MQSGNPWLRSLGLALAMWWFITGGAGTGSISAQAQVAGQSDESIRLVLTNATFDPLQEAPSVPENLVYSPNEAAENSVYILQFIGPVLPEWKAAIQEAGGFLGDYLPNYAFLAYLEPDVLEKVSTLPFVRWIGAYQPAFKISPSLNEEARSFRVMLTPWDQASGVRAALDTYDPNIRSFDGGIAAVLDRSQVEQVAFLPVVTWIEPYSLQRLHNDISGGTIMGGSTAWANGYSGLGVILSVTDTGLDTDNPNALHQDFAGRLAHISSWPVLYVNYGSGCETTNAGANDGAVDLASGHGTHVAGSAVGDGARSGGQFKGLAYEATLVFQAIEQYSTWLIPNPFICPDGYYLTGIPDDIRLLLSEAYNWGARVQNNSWGGGTFGVYDQQASYFDNFIFSHPDMTIVVSAGNSGTDSNSDGYVDESSIASPASAKNLITIGASDNERISGGLSGYTWGQLWSDDFLANPTRDDFTSDFRQELAAFSSRGPVNDGRLKPDVVAPGTNILSTRSSQSADGGWGIYNAYYKYLGGTSMASPLAAGAAALVRDYYISTEGQVNPSAALIKATLVNTAIDISGYGNNSREAGQPVPNPHEGWGLINLGAATTRGSRMFVDRTTGITTGTTLSYRYTITSGKPLKITLAWSDYPASPIAGKALVNDLNLRVTSSDGITQYWGNRFSGGWSQTGGIADYLNNLENVYIQVPGAGTWTVEVIGQNIPMGPQPFALVVNGNVSLAEPLVVRGVSPAYAPNQGVAQDIRVYGEGFLANATAQLVRGAQVINGINISVDTVRDRLIADIPLTGVTPGKYDVRINQIGESAILKDAFTVIDATLPNLAVLLGTWSNQVSPGSWLTYTIEINNPGLIAATQVVFTATLPAGVAFENLEPACLGGVDILPGLVICQVNPSTVAVGARLVYNLEVSVPSSLQGFLIGQVSLESAQADGFPADNTGKVTVLSGYGGPNLPLVQRKAAHP